LENSLRNGKMCTYYHIGRPGRTSYDSNGPGHEVDKKLITDEI